MARAWLRRVAWITLALALIWALWCALAWWVLPPWLKSQAESRLAVEFGRPVTIAQLRIDPFEWTLEIQGLTIAAPGAGRPPLLRLPRALVDLSSASLRLRALVFDRIEIDGLRLAIERTGRWQLDIDDLVKRWLAPRSTPGDGALPRLLLQQLRVRDAALALDDRRSGGSHRIDALDLDLPLLSTLPDDADRTVTATLALRLDGSAIKLAAEGAPWAKPRRSQVQIDIEPLDLHAWASDLDSLLPLRLQSGRVASVLTLRVTQAPGAAPSLAVSGSLGVSEMQWHYPGGEPALGWRDLRIQLGDLQPQERRVDIRRVELDGLMLPVARDRGGQLNLVQLAPAKPEHTEPAPAGESRPWQIGLDELAVAGTTIAWRDATTSPAAAIDIADLQLKLTRLRWPLAEAPALQVSASLRPQGGKSAGAGKLTVSGEASPRAAALQFALDGFALAALQPYLSAFLVPRIDAGSAAVHGHVEWSVEQGSPRLTLDDARIDGLAIGGAGWRSLKASGVTLDLAQRQASVGSLRLDQPHLSLARDREGRWNLAGWLRAAPAAPSKPSAHQDADRAAPPWRLRLDRLDLGGGRLDFEDALPAREPASLALRVDMLQLHSRALRWPLPRGAPALPLHASGNIVLTTAAGAADPPRPWTLDGSVAPSLPAFTGTLELDRLPLAALARYAPMPQNLQLLDADAGLRTRVVLVRTDDGWRVAVDGDAQLDGLRVAEVLAASAADTPAAADLLRWRSLAASGLHLQLAPETAPALTVSELKLAGLDAKLVVTEQGELNLATVAATAGRQAAAPKAAAATSDGAGAGGGPPPTLEIGLTRLLDAHIDFEDHFIRPNYRAELSALDGQLGTFRTGSTAMAPLVLGGRVAGTGKVEISGELNPTARPLALNLRARATDIDLPPLSAYSGKYAGYGITDGKLSMDLTYRVAPDGRLQARNRLVLNQLTFGEPVESPSATKLPVRFIVALLKDRNGVIDFEVPVEGSIDQPDFHLGALIVQVLLKLLGQAVSSPFSVLAGGDSGSLGAVEFVPGTPTPAPGAAQVMDKVAAALADRPSLTLDVAGSADPVAEREALQRAVLDTRLEALRQLAQPASVPGGAPPVPLVDGEERDQLLRQLYRQTALPTKPRNAIGWEVDITPPQMAALLQAAIPAGEDAMRDLALQRGLAVRTGLLGRGLASERLFVGTPVLRSSGDGGGGGDAGWTPRAQLSLIVN